MNTRLNIKTLVGVVAVLALLALTGLSVQAQTTSTAPDAPVDSSITVPVKGSVSDPNGTVTLSGNVIISCRRVIDNLSTTTPALVLLDFDFSQVKGTSGSLKTLKSYVTGGNHANEIRPLQAGDTIIVTIPYYDSTKDEMSSRTMLATATLNFDITSGKLTSGSLSVGNNVVTSAQVGTTTTAPIQ